MDKELTFSISIPTPEGFIGRECNNPSCKRYFKILGDHIKDKMYCPYCGTLFRGDELWTQDQLNYTGKVVKEEATAYVAGELDNVLKKAFKKSPSRSSGFSVSYKSKPYRKKHVPISYKEKEVDSQITCPQCQTIFQVYGIFGYCPSCKHDSILIYETNISIILSEIKNAPDKDRALRHAYNDLVSTFENFCKKKNSTEKQISFQNIENAGKFFNRELNIDIFSNLSGAEVTSIKRIFQKRHAYQHNKGIMDDKYIKQIPEDREFLGKKTILTEKEFLVGTKILRKILEKLI